VITNKKNVQRLVERSARNSCNNRLLQVRPTTVANTLSGSIIHWYLFVLSSNQSRFHVQFTLTFSNNVFHAFIGRKLHKHANTGWSKT